MEYFTPVLNKENNPYDDSKLIKEQHVSADDGRPVIAQLWAESGYTFISYYFCQTGLERANDQELLKYLTEQGFKLNSDCSYTLSMFKDEAEKDCWSLTFTIGESEE